MSQTSLERFCVRIDRLEAMLLSTRVPLQISNLQTQPKAVYGSCDPIKWYHFVISDDVKEDILSETTKLTPKTKPFKSDPSSFQNSTKIIKPNPYIVFNLNKDDQGVQLSQTHSPTLTNCHCSRSWYWLGHQLHLAKTKYFYNFFP